MEWFSVLQLANHNSVRIAWPSGLRRQLKALVRKGVGSNPTAVIVLFFVNVLFFQCRFSFTALYHVEFFGTIETSPM